MSTPDAPADTLKAKRQSLAERKAAHNNPAYAKMSYLMGLGIQGSGRGSYVEDHLGRRFLAMFDQYGNQAFGYSNERVVEAIRESLDSGILNSTKIMLEEDQVLLAERLSEITGNALPYAYFANGGGESIDNALKLARAYTRRPKFVTAIDCFHGKTFGALSASGRADHKAMFDPLLDHFEQVPYGDVAAIEAAIDDTTAAVLLEPIMAEGGVFVPTVDYLQSVRRLCDERGAVLIFDEMQTAFGRCGTFFAHQTFGVTPDLLCIGKAFGGGVVAISAVMGTREVWAPLAADPSTFGSSLGGNPLSTRVGLESVAIASDPDFLEDVRRKSALVDARLAALAARHPGIILAHRGTGMMHGLELRSGAHCGLVLNLLFKRGVTSTFCLYNTAVLRIQPPLTISMDDLGNGLDVLDAVFGELEGLGSALDDNSLWDPAVHVAFPVNATAAAVMSYLATRVNRLDPFADNPDAPAEEAGSNIEFAGTLGDDVVVWPNVVTVDATRIRSVASPCWVWDALEREVSVRDHEGGSIVDVRIAWNAGTGDYEPFVGGAIKYFVTRRLVGMAEQFAAEFGPSIETEQPTAQGVSVEA